MRILVLNRRDIKNPAGGGAEVYTHEIACGLASKYNCEINIFTSRFPEAKAVEVIDKVTYLRQGNELTVHIFGFIYALGNRDKFDLIIDEFNGLGFFTFFFRNSRLLIHQFYREFWFLELHWLGIVPYILEPLMVRLYSRKQAITVSVSTKSDLERLGFKDVVVVMNAVKNPVGSYLIQKETHPTLIFLGRLRKTKRPEEALKIFQELKPRFPDLKLWVVGCGPEENRLKEMALLAGLNDVVFFGRVSDEKKTELLSKAHILLVPSIREGFGLNVIEAACCLTPAVGYRVSGLRDSILHNKTGFLARDVQEMAGFISLLLTDHSLYDTMSLACLSYTQEFRWDRRVDEFWHKVLGR